MCVEWRHRGGARQKREVDRAGFISFYISKEYKSFASREHGRSKIEKGWFFIIVDPF